MNMNQAKAATPPVPRMTKEVRGIRRPIARHHGGRHADRGECEYDDGKKLRRGDPDRQIEPLQQEAGGTADIAEGKYREIATVLLVAPQQVE